ncbi:MAG: helix-turn-helix transcriptional regulator [Rhodocyclaceae bacterium]|nr:MAG: helix-turn-helix transcriptional regulator [Rhodocyclaceae bacterium]
MNKLAETRRDRLRQIVEKMGLSPAAKRFGKPDRQINDMIAGRKSFGEKVASDMETEFAPDVAPGWLGDSRISLPDIVFTDSNGQATFLEVKKFTPRGNDKSDNVVIIKHYDTGGAMGDGGVILRDQPGLIESWTVTPEWIAKNIRNCTAAANLCIVTGFGDSMRPLYEPGDPLIVDTGVKSVDFDGIYFFRVGNEGFIKRLQRIPGEGIVAISENKAYRDWTIKSDMDFEVFGRIVKAWRSEDY